MPVPSPSTEMKLSIWPFKLLPNSSFIPRRSPKPSSPTSATNVIVPCVWTFASFKARITPRTTTNPRQSSPIPGPFITVPSRVTLTFVPSGKTVSRCAARTRLGRGLSPGRVPITLPALSMWTFCNCNPSKSRFSSRPRCSSWNGGAAISQMRACSSSICGSFRSIALKADLIPGSFRSAAGFWACTLPIKLNRSHGERTLRFGILSG